MSHVAEMLVCKLSLHSLWVTILQQVERQATAYWVSDAALVLTSWLSQMLTFSNSLLDMSGQSQIFQINNKETSVLITETDSKFMDANIGANRLNRGQQSTIHYLPLPPLPFRAFELHFCLYRVYCIELTDTSIKLKRKF